MTKPKTASALKWDLRELQKKLKKLGVAPPPPKGKPVLADIMKPGKFYAHPPNLAALERYFVELTTLHEQQSRTWTLPVGVEVTERRSTGLGVTGCGAPRSRSG